MTDLDGTTAEQLADGRPWQERAACLGIDPELFFPQRGEDTAQAKAVCDTCAVAEECLNFALDNGEKFGIWGGLSERERRRLRRQRAIARRPIEHGAPGGYEAHRRRDEVPCLSCREARNAATAKQRERSGRADRPAKADGPVVVELHRLPSGMARGSSRRTR